MRMEAEVLTPGVQDSCESNFCPQAVPLPCGFEQGLCSGPEQEVIKQALVLKDDCMQLMGYGEDHVKVRCRKDFLKSALDPVQALQSLTFRTVPIATGVVRDTLVSAPVLAYVHMAAQGLCPTGFNVSHCLALLGADRILETVLRTIGAKDVCHLETRPCLPHDRGES